ncbi:MAG: glycosyltransferase, partial [Ruminococcaceae bacterium]|nr:glycosyltransferase [Oscillospiraceae bacterium]
MGRKRTLSLCVIVQEEESAVEECLESVGDAADEIILVDIGSAGKIAETAEKFGAKVYSFPWNGSISDVRNYSISKAGGKWVLLMDDCEVFEKSGREALADYV